jgi:hypothetical protein
MKAVAAKSPPDDDLSGLRRDQRHRARKDGDLQGRIEVPYPPPASILLFLKKEIR